jgi:cathepsin D
VTDLGQNLVDGAVSGIMGLAWSRLSSTGADPFWFRLATDDALTTKNMSFWLKRQLDNPSPADLTDGGVFTLGGVNDTLYTGDIEWLPIVQPASFWLLELSRTAFIYNFWMVLIQM